MRCGLGVAAALALAGATAAAAASVDRDEFRYTRRVDAPGPGPIALEPDGPLFAHARGGLVDLRVVDDDGNQVPWRRLPPSVSLGAESITILNQGRRDGVAVALLDLGPERRVHDRIDLEIPDENFVGRVVVLGSDTRRGRFTRLSETGIYDVRGAERARSTIAVFPPTDFRFLEVRATGVSAIEAAAVSGAAQRPEVVERRLRLTRTRQDGERTIVTLDAGFRNLPIDELVVTSETARYDRRVLVEGSNRGVRFRLLAGARIFRFPGSSPSPINLASHHRYLRLTIENGDDEPLRRIDVTGRARSRAILLEGGHARPYTLLYGDRDGIAPEYDFARLPRGALRLGRVERGRFAAERRNPEFSAAEEPRSFADEHPRVVQLSLAAAALVVAFAGALAFRRRTEEES